MLSYTVKHGFSQGDTWYTRENADQIKALPRAVRDDLIQLGHIEEHDDRGSAAEPAVPANTGKEK